MVLYCLVKDLVRKTELSRQAGGCRLVISDIDGTITKSDLLGHVLPRVGWDWHATAHLAGTYTSLEVTFSNAACCRASAETRARTAFPVLPRFAWRWRAHYIMLSHTLCQKLIPQLAMCCRALAGTSTPTKSHFLVVTTQCGWMVRAMAPFRANLLGRVLPCVVTDALTNDHLRVEIWLH